jgi:hypothetical protein
MQASVLSYSLRINRPVLIKTLMNSQPPTSARRASKAMLEVNLE